MPARYKSVTRNSKSRRNYRVHKPGLVALSGNFAEKSEMRNRELECPIFTREGWLLDDGLS